MSVPRDRHATLNGLRFHWLERGTPSGPPLLLIHGAAQTAHSFDEVAPDLARDHFVVSIDQRGHGDTAWAPRYRREDFVRDIGAILDHHGWSSVTLIAMSLGGLNSMAFTAAHPDRVRGLVVVDVVPTIAPRGREEIGRQLGIRDFASFEDAVAQAHAFNPRRTLENIRERLGHAMREQPDGRWGYKFDPGIVGGAEADLDRLWADVRKIRCPALLLRGAESPILTAEAAERFTREVRGAVTAEVAGAGHSVMGDNPSGFLAAVRPFLTRHGL
jgi:pimeloyl-ACP methyl ester carboxylesterase